MPSVRRSADSLSPAAAATELSADFLQPPNAASEPASTAVAAPFPPEAEGDARSQKHARALSYASRRRLRAWSGSSARQLGKRGSRFGPRTCLAVRGAFEGGKGGAQVVKWAAAAGAEGGMQGVIIAVLESKLGGWT